MPPRLDRCPIFSQPRGDPPDVEPEDKDGPSVRLSSLRGRPGLENPLSRLALYLDEMPRIHTLARRLKHIDPVILAARGRESLEMLDRFFVRRTEIAILLDRTREVPRCSDTEKYLETSLLHRMGKVRRQFINKRDGGKTEAVGRVESLL